MARPQSADFEQRREAMLDAAAALFAERGFAGTSMAELAAACGTSKSLVYHYFPAKEEILYALMAGHIEALAAAAAAVSGGAREQLAGLMRRFMTIYAGAGARQKVLLNEMDKLSSERRAQIVSLQRGLIETVEKLLSELEPGLAADRARRRAAAMLVFGMLNWTHTWYDPAGPVAPDALADMTLGLIERGLAGAVSAPAASPSGRARSG